jgi:hypothetical protein
MRHVARVADIVNAFSRKNGRKEGRKEVNLWGSLGADGRL